MRDVDAVTAAVASLLDALKIPQKGADIKIVKWDDIKTVSTEEDR
jgi:hypothetical protein